MKKYLLLLFLPLALTAQSYVVDPSFNAGNTGVTGIGGVKGSIIQPDGKIIIFGDFTQYNGIARKHIARVNADGTLDTSFDPGSGPSISGTTAIIDDAILVADDKIVVVGTFTFFNTVSMKHIARLNSDGSVDATFNGDNLLSSVDDMPSVRLYSVKETAEGKLLIGGTFRVTGNTNKYIARLDNTGAFDPTFIYPTGSFFIGSYVNDIELQPDGKIVLAATHMGSIEPIVRLNSDGSKDTSFVTPGGYYGFGRKILLTENGKILLGGISIIESETPTGLYLLLKFNADGSLDATFDKVTASSSSTGVNDIRDVKIFGGKLLIGGKFADIEGNSIKNFARLNADGTFDDTFLIGSAASNTVLSMTIDESDRIYLGGYFNAFNGDNAPRFVRIGDATLSMFETHPNNFSFVNTGMHYSFKSSKPMMEITVFNIEGKKLRHINSINSDNFLIPAGYGNGLKIFKVSLNDGSAISVKTID